MTYLQHFMNFTASVMIPLAHICMEVTSLWQKKKNYADDAVYARESFLFIANEWI